MNRVPTLSGVTVVRDAVELGYPLEASIRSYLPICDEVVLAYDPRSRDGTADLVADVARREPAIRPLASTWARDNRTGGDEIRVQSERAVLAARGDWVLYVQADEVIHEDDHAAILAALRDPALAGALFDRRMFLGTLDREMPEHRNCGLLRLFRAGSARVAGDGVTCELVQGEARRVLDAGWRMFDYGRVGPVAAVLRRKRALHALYHSSERVIAARLATDLWQTVRRFDPAGHPAAIRSSSLAVRPAPLVTLAVLLGPGEHDQVPAFARQFDPWGGDVVVIDDSGGDGACQALCEALLDAVDRDPGRIAVVARPEASTNADARNLAHELARGESVLHADVDERFDGPLLRRLCGLANELQASGATVCGLPRANFLDGVLANDVAPSRWTERELAREPGFWPPRNRDVQYRLLTREERWVGELHEQPVAAGRSPERTVRIDGAWIVHDKSLERQRRQDRSYRAQGQAPSMPGATAGPEAPGPESPEPDVEPARVPTSKGYRFLFVDGPGPPEESELALGAYRRAFRHDDDVALLVVGAGRLVERVRELEASSHGAQVVLVDPAARGPGLYAACDCLLATYRELDHGVIAEAMAAGLAVVAPDRGPWLNYCDARTAFLFPAAGMAARGALVALMHHLVADRERGRAVGALAARTDVPERALWGATRDVRGVRGA